MNVQECLSQLSKSGTKLKTTANQLEIEGSIDPMTIDFLKNNKTEVLNQLYGLNDIQKGTLVYDGFFEGHVVQVYPHTNKVGYQCEGKTHPNYQEVWKLQPVLKVTALNLNLRIPHGRELWPKILLRGLEKVGKIQTTKEQEATILSREKFLYCNWDLYSAWKFARYLENYLLAHIPPKR